jgi:hypothetical protein
MIHETNCVLYAVIGGAMLAGCTTARTELTRPTDAACAFEQYEIVTGAAPHQTVLPAFLLGGAAAEVAVVRVDGQGERHVSVYGYGVVPQPPRGEGAEFIVRLADGFGEGTWLPMLDAPLGSHVQFVDVATGHERDSLITYAPGRLCRLDTASATERELAALSFDFRPPDDGGVPHVDITRDLNGDGRDDIVLPDFDGFHVMIQTGDGVFADPVKLGPPEPHLDAVAYGDSVPFREVGMTVMTIPWYQARVHVTDFDRDGRVDLVFWREGRFEVHRQDERGLFGAEAESFACAVAFESVGPKSLIFGFGDVPTQTVLLALEDFNGDGVTDLVTYTLAGTDFHRLQTAHAVHFGTPTPGGTAFAPEPDTATSSDHIQGGTRPHDLDGDGRLDMMFTTIDPAIPNVLWAFLTRSFHIDIEFYRMEDGCYPDEPDATRTVTADFDVIRDGEDAFSPAVLLGDVNGDGRSDLVLGKDRDELHLFVGVPEAALFVRDPQRIAVRLPSDEERSVMRDLDLDGKQDVLMHLPSRTEPHRVTLLIAR